MTQISKLPKPTYLLSYPVDDQLRFQENILSHLGLQIALILFCIGYQNPITFTNH